MNSVPQNMQTVNFHTVDAAIETRFSNISKAMVNKIKHCDGDDEKMIDVVKSSLWYIKHDVVQILMGMTQQEPGDESKKPVANCVTEPMNPPPSPQNQSVKEPTTEDTTKQVKTPGIMKKIRALDFPLPFQVNLVDPDACQGLKLNHSLYTQCTTKPRKNQTYCNTCLKQIAGNETKMPNAGSIQLRMDTKLPMDFRDPKGKRPTHYTNVLTKLKLSKEEIVSKTAEVGIVIDECHLTCPEKPKKGRRKKVATTVMEDDVIQTNPIVDEDETTDENTDENVAEEPKQDKIKDNDQQDDDADECVDVIEIIYNDTVYLKDKDNEIIDEKTMETVGKYNDITEDIDFY